MLGRDKAASLTVNVDSLLITVIIEASGNQDVAVIDLQGAYLHVNRDDLVVMVIRGQLAELMVETAPEIHCNYMTYHNGKAILHVSLQKVILWMFEVCFIALVEIAQ